MAANKNTNTSKKSVKPLMTLQTVSLVLAIALFIFGAICSYKAGKQRDYQKAAEQIEVAITQKAAGDVGYSSLDNDFTFVIKNNSELTMEKITGELKISNADGKILSTGTAYFTGSFTPGSEQRFVLNWSTEITDDAIELMQSELDWLNISYKITEIVFEDKYEAVKVECEPYVKPCNIDAVDNLKNSYQQAKTLYDNGDYAAAAEMFEALGDYKDSQDLYFDSLSKLELSQIAQKYNNALALYGEGKYGEALALLEQITQYGDSYEKIAQIIAAAETAADALAATGDYTGARELLAEVGYDLQDYRTMYPAYHYASQGDFATAVQYGLSVVIIPEGTQMIPDNYFKDTSHSNQLTKVVLPSTIRTIGSAAFKGCARLTEINLPEGILSIANETFADCGALRSIQLPNSLLTIGNSAFSGCSALTEINFPASLQSIGSSAFSSCNALTSVETPSSLISMGTGVFANCSSLMTVNLRGSFTAVKENTFRNCRRLVSVTLASGIEVIESYVFYDCAALVAVTLPDTLLEIKSNAFYNCASLAEVTMPASLNKIGTYVFVGCGSLQNVRFEDQEGWTNGVSNIDVSDSRRNANLLKSSTSGWTKRQG